MKFGLTNISSHPDSLKLAYNNLISSKKIAGDAAQEKCLNSLSALRDEIISYKATQQKFFSRILKGKKIVPPVGIYIYGGVGRGKSMLMDLFFASLPSSIRSRRVHFHAFMSEVHSRMKVWSGNKDTRSQADVMVAVAAEIADSAEVLCFDEVVIQDIADAMIIGRLVECLLKEGVIIVATSNRHPDDLYQNGLHRDRFTPFIAMIKRKLQIIELASKTDYRKEKLKSINQTYYYPLDKFAPKFVKNTFNSLVDDDSFTPVELTVKGRKILVERCSGDTAIFDFAELFDRALGSEDYLEITLTFANIILENIPVLKRDDFNSAFRFTRFIDAAYESKTRLFITAKTAPRDIYTVGEGGFEFERTVSRLMEMQSEEYLSARS